MLCQSTSWELPNSCIYNKGNCMKLLSTVACLCLCCRKSRFCSSQILQTKQISSIFLINSEFIGFIALGIGRSLEKMVVFLVKSSQPRRLKPLEIRMSQNERHPTKGDSRCNPDAPWDWYIYLHENHKFKPNVGKCSIDGASG